MATNSKNKGIIKLLIALIVITCVVIVGKIAFDSYLSASDSMHGDFESNKKASAEVLYSDIKNTDLKTNYPQTPDEVMQFYGKCYKLLYGDMIRNEDIFAEVLHIQRNLFSTELAEKNTFEAQLEKLKEGVEQLKSQKISVIDVESKPPMYDKEYNTCEVRTTINTNATNEDGSPLKAYMLFNIIKDENGLWKINSFRTTDSNFN